MSGEQEIAVAARNLSDSIARLKEDTARYSRGKIDDLRGSTQKELNRRLTVLIGFAALGVLGFLGVIFGAVAIILAFGDTHPALAAAGVAAGFFLLAGVGAILAVRAHRRKPKAMGRLASVAGLLWRVSRAVR
jgi:VIT1/CCC1 family predicted Fe2+/Mn2+ transporter